MWIYLSIPFGSYLYLLNLFKFGPADNCFNLFHMPILLLLIFIHTVLSWIYIYIQNTPIIKYNDILESKNKYSISY